MNADHIRQRAELRKGLGASGHSITTTKKMDLKDAEIMLACADVVEQAQMISDPKQWIQNEWTKRIGDELRVSLAKVEAIKP